MSEPPGRLPYVNLIREIQRFAVILIAVNYIIIL